MFDDIMNVVVIIFFILETDFEMIFQKNRAIVFEQKQI